MKSILTILFFLVAAAVVGFLIAFGITGSVGFAGCIAVTCAAVSHATMTMRISGIGGPGPSMILALVSAGLGGFIGKNPDDYDPDVFLLQAMVTFIFGFAAAADLAYIAADVVKTQNVHTN
ncbi:MAG: hypothetical protein KBC38_02120 [Candidatus Pacebacteria bacterium]|nr:hypothetical protein [Candidatus Paceibacterota bacterium]MBP9840679.1 hypothetical protein [Candidatus Paceibacterota bacterium]